MKRSNFLGQSLHFIGIGGIGMSALASLVAEKETKVSGSDQKSTTQLESLTSKSIKIFPQQEEKNIKELLEQEKERKLSIVISSAIPADNPELIAAQKLNLQILHRSDILAYLVNNQPSIVVTGTHGKTTTSAIAGTLLALNNQDPSLAIGGIVPHFQSNSHSGNGKYLVAEGDESDGSIIKLNPEIGVITNLELDHIDHYSNLNELIKTMQIFGNQSTLLLANYDCPNLRKNISAAKWWSTKAYKGVNLAGLPISQKEGGIITDIYENEAFISRVRINIPGLHNLSNIMGAILTCRELGLSFEQIINTLPKLSTPKRRFEFLGSWKSRYFYDDYAHHPSEIKATLSMAKSIINSHSNKFPNPPKRTFLVFQPHRYSRTKKFLYEFADALSKSDYLILTPIYGAGEEPSNEISSELLARKVHESNPKLSILLANNLTDASNLIKKKSLENDLIITMGAGNITNIWEQFHITNNNMTSLTNLAA